MTNSFIQNKKVLFICSSLNFGGAQKVISNITGSLPEQYDIDILLNSDDNIEYPYRGNIISLGIKEPKSRESVFYQLRVFCHRIHLIRYLKKKKDYNAVISILTSANVANVLCKSDSCKVIITEVALQRESKTIKGKYIVGPLIKMFYNKADVIVAETNMIRSGLIDDHNINPEKICVIPNSIDVPSIRSQKDVAIDTDERHMFDKNKTFITAGRLVQQKGQWHLIRAFSEVVKRNKEARLVIFGEGELYGYLKKLITDYDLTENVFLLGFTNKLDVYLSNSLAFVFPSMHEGMPTVLLQAMAAGIPCIVTDFYSGAREVLGDSETPEGHISDILYSEWGIMTPVCSGRHLGAEELLEKEEKLLAEAMISVMSDDSLRKRYENASERRSEYFDNSNVIKKWMEIM